MEGTHEAIIDEETFYTVQKLMALRTREDGTGTIHPLAGLVKCMDCGGTMSKTTNGRKGVKQVSYLRCKLYADSGEQKLCTHHSIRLDRLIELVLERLRYYVQSYYILEELELPTAENTRRDTLAQEKKSLVAQLEKRSAALKNLYLDKVSGVLSEDQFVELNRDFLAEKSRLEKRLAQIDVELSACESPAQQTELLEKAQALLELKTLPRELAVELIERIEIGERDVETREQKVHIVWKF